MSLDRGLRDIKIILQEIVWVILKNDDIPIPGNLINLPPSLEGQCTSSRILRAADYNLVSLKNCRVARNDARDRVKYVRALPL